MTCAPERMSRDSRLEGHPARKDAEGSFGTGGLKAEGADVPGQVGFPVLSTLQDRVLASPPGLQSLSAREDKKLTRQ